MMDGWRSIEFSGAACDWFPATDVVVVLCGDMSLSPCQDVPSLNVFFMVTWPQYAGTGLRGGLNCVVRTAWNFPLKRVLQWTLVGLCFEVPFSS